MEYTAIDDISRQAWPRSFLRCKTFAVTSSISCISKLMKLSWTTRVFCRLWLIFGQFIPRTTSRNFPCYKKENVTHSNLCPQEPLPLPPAHELYRPYTHVLFSFRYHLFYKVKSIFFKLKDRKLKNIFNVGNNVIKRLAWRAYPRQPWEEEVELT